MLDIDTGNETEALYKMFRIKGGKKELKFQNTDINLVLKFHKYYISKYKEGLYMEICRQKKSYNWKEKTVGNEFGK